jgi:hypothetical protein
MIIGIQAALAAWFVFAAMALSAFVDEALPTYYLLRPLLLAAPIALLIGLTARLAVGRHCVVAALLSAVLVARPDWWQGPVIAGASYGAYQLVSRSRPLPSIISRASLAAMVFAAVFAAPPALELLSSLDPVSAPSVPSTERGRNIYLILVDGYAREDTLITELGIDNSAFVAQLADHGFDVYDTATSDRTWTELTLLSLFSGSTDGVPEGPVHGRDKKPLRERLASAPLPIRAQEAGYRWTVIDAPIGHVTFAGGHHIQHGGINNFEERLLGRSLFAPLFVAIWPYFVMDSVRGHLESSLDSLQGLADPGGRQLIFAHLLAPHTPFLWDSGGRTEPIPSYWPEVQLFESVSETLGLSTTEYAQGLRGHLDEVNRRLLHVLSSLAEADPDAAIVVFSDHGSRHSLAGEDDEWHRTFLAARTPEHERLFGANPKPAMLLRRLLDTYLP